MAGVGQGRDCFAPRREDRIRIPKPASREWDREKTGTAGFDPGAEIRLSQLSSF